MTAPQAIFMQHHIQYPYDSTVSHLSASQAKTTTLITDFCSPTSYSEDQLDFHGYARSN